MAKKKLRQIAIDNPSVPNIRPGREKAWARLHKIVKTLDANGNDDDVFKASKVKVNPQAKPAVDVTNNPPINNYDDLNTGRHEETELDEANYSGKQWFKIRSHVQKHDDAPWEERYHQVRAKTSKSAINGTMERLQKDFPDHKRHEVEIVEAHDINHPIYKTRQKVRKYNVPVHPLSADYSTGGKMLRQRLPKYSKEDHIQAGDAHRAAARHHQSEHARLADHAHADLKKRGVHPGPLISGIQSDKFSDTTKNALRHHAHTSSDHSSAAMAHYAAAGLRVHTARNRLHEDIITDEINEISKKIIDKIQYAKGYWGAKAKQQKKWLNPQYLKGRAAGTVQQIRQKFTKEETILKGMPITEGMPTRKHFQQVADIVKNVEDPVKRKELAHHHAAIFKQQNPRFDHKRFLAAANVKEETQLDETSSEKRQAYLAKARPDRENAMGRILGTPVTVSVKPQDIARYRKRSAGIAKATKEETQLDEKLGKNASTKTYIDDFIKSDAPQFKGKSKAKRIQMAIAAHYSAQRGEETELDEARYATPIKGHPYHEKSDAELHYIMKDAHKAAKAMQGHDTRAEAKYLDQVNDAATVLAHRRRHPAAGFKANAPKPIKEEDHGATHQLRIARQTLKMPDAMVGVMGGPNKRQAAEIVKRHKAYKQTPYQKARRKYLRSNPYEETLNELTKEKLAAYTAKASASQTDAILAKDKKKFLKRSMGMNKAKALIRSEETLDELTGKGKLGAIHDYYADKLASQKYDDPGHAIGKKLNKVVRLKAAHKHLSDAKEKRELAKHYAKYAKGQRAKGRSYLQKSAKQYEETLDELTKEKLAAYTAKASASQTDAILKKDKKTFLKRSMGMNKAKALVRGEETIGETIMNPNSSGQGYDDTHRHHPLHDTITKHGFHYSHSTPIHQRDRTVKIHHTYAHGEHKVGVYAHSHEWDSKVSSASGHHHSGSGAASLDKHLRSKVKRYKLG